MTAITRLPVLLLAACLALGTVLALASPASAAWRTVSTFEGATLQACRATVDGGPAVKMRVDSRAAERRVRGGLIRDRGDRSSVVQASPVPGRVSAVRSLTLRPGDHLVTLVGEVRGPTMGGGISRSSLPRC